MSTVLSKGFVKPQAGDLGQTWMPEHEDNIQQLNDHDHDGLNSQLIDAISLTKQTSVVLAASWVADGGGNFSQVISVPAAISEINNHLVKIYDQATGDFLNLGIERVSASSIRIRINDNSLTVVAVYV